MQIILFIVAWVLSGIMFAVLIVGICVPTSRVTALIAMGASVAASAIASVMVAWTAPEVDIEFILKVIVVMVPVFFGVLAIPISVMALITLAGARICRHMSKRSEIAA